MTGVVGESRKASGVFVQMGGLDPWSAPDRALGLLLDSIRAGFFEVGDQLPNLRDLARELGVSHVVARQALEVMVKCGIVEVRPGRGGGITVVGLAGLPKALATIYAVPTRAEAASLLEARELLEVHIGRRACELATAGDIERLADVVERLEAARKFPDLVELTVRFHLQLGLAARNPTLTRFLREILNRMAIVGLKRRTMAPGQPFMDTVVEIYRNTLDAVEQRDPIALESDIRERMPLLAQIYRLDWPSPGDR